MPMDHYPSSLKPLGGRLSGRFLGRVPAFPLLGLALMKQDGCAIKDVAHVLPGTDTAKERIS